MPGLTKREKEILQLIAQGFRNQEIADKLSLSIRTIENHRFNLIQKLQVNNAAALIRESHRYGSGLMANHRKKRIKKKKNRNRREWLISIFSILLLHDQ